MEKKQITLYVANPNGKMMNPEYGDSDEDFVASMNNSKGYAMDYGDASHYTYFNIKNAWYMAEYHYNDISANGDCGISYKQLAYLFEILGFDVCITDGFPDWVKNKDDAYECTNISDERCNHWKDHKLISTSAAADQDTLGKIAPLLDELKNKGYECSCSVLDGDVNIRVEGTMICNSDVNHNCLGIRAGYTSTIIIANGHHTGIISVSNHGGYTTIATVVDNIDLLEIFIDRMC